MVCAGSKHPLNGFFIEFPDVVFPDAFAIERDLTASTVEDWSSSESVFAVYVMGSYTVGDLDLIAGVRLEKTKFETHGFELDEEAETATAIRAERNIEEWLPGFHAG